MGGRLLAGTVATLIVALAPAASAGGFGGGFHGGGFRLPMGHSWGGGGRPAYRAGGWNRARSLPPVAGVIHERPGARPFYSGYGHLNTGVVPYGSGFRRFAGGLGGSRFGHVATAFRGGDSFRYGRARLGGYRDGRWAGDRFGDRRRIAIYRFGGAFGGGYGGVYGAPYPGYYGGGGGEPDAGGSYAPGADGSYGHDGSEVDGGGAYQSEPPLAASRAEPPLAPSPYGDDGGYYGAPRLRAPHIITIDRSAGCDCRPAAGAYPTIYRYGVGTAY